MSKTYPPHKKVTLEKFSEDFSTLSRIRPEYRLVCTRCKFEHSGTMGARHYPHWFLVTWVCLSCRHKEI
jgi:hypothetical protein